MRGFSPLDVMALRNVRDASEAGAGLAVLDAALGEVLWANGAGHTLLGLSRADGELSATSAQGRQIRAAARLIEARGEARLLLRPAAGLASKPVVTDLKRIAASGHDVILLTAPAMRPAETSDVALAERLLSETGLDEAAIYGPNGLVTAAGDVEARAVAVPLDAIAALIDSNEECSVVDGDGCRIRLSRIASRLVLVRRESVAPAAADPDGQRQAPVPGAEPPSRTAGYFSVKRQKLPASRGAIGMSALVQRWHRRQDGDEASPDEMPGTTEPASGNEDETLGNRDQGEVVPSKDATAAPGSEASPLAEEARDADSGTPAVAVGEGPYSDDGGPTQAIPAQIKPPSLAALRSRWGALKEDADTESRAQADTAETSASASTDGANAWQSSATTADETEIADEDQGSQTPASVSIEDERAESARARSETTKTHLASEEPAPPREEPAVKEAPIPVPSNAPPGTDGEAGQPVEKESVVILPDVHPDDAPLLDVPISDDAEVPDGEAMVPVKEEEPAREVPPQPSASGAETGTVPADRDEPVAADADLTDALPSRGFEPRFDGAPVRFVWQIDREGKFHSLSSEFAAAVGPKAAEVVGLSFREVANVFGFDAGGEIARLLDRRDTWSGRSILWPVEASDRKVPVDLAALPVYARDRSFDGFRGFGIVKLNEAVVDADAIGLLLAGDREVEAMPEPVLAEPAEAVAPGIPERPLLRTFEADLPGVAFGRRQEPPQPSGASASDGDGAGLPGVGSNDDDGEPKVIRLEERRRPRDGVLSQAEEAAFRAIGMKLGQGSEAEAPGAPRLVDQAANEVAPTASEQSIDGSGVADMPPVDGPMPTTGELISAVPVAAPIDDAMPAEEAEPVEARPFEMDISAAEAAAEADAGVDPASVRDAGHEGDRLISDEAEIERDAVDRHGLAGTPPEDDGEDDEAVERPFDAAAMAGELEAIFASLPLPVLVQVRGTLLYANREFEDLSGYASLAELEAAGGLDALFVEREDGLKAGELAIRRSNGQVADVRVHMQRVTFSGRSALLMSFSPSPRASAAAAHPPSETMPADASAAHEVDDLRQEIEELQAVLDTATDGVVLLDPAGTIRAMNGSAHALFGGGLSEHAGRHLATLFAHESQKATHDYLDMLRDDGLAGILNDGREVIGRVAQGGFIPLFITIGRLSGERGWCVVMRDIAHWKRIEEDLVNARRQAEAASLHKSRFLANISHELRTPLNAIIGFADVMASECFGPIGNERYLEYLGDIKRSGHHVLDLVNDLLDISKIEAGKLDLAFEAVSLNEVVSEVVSLMQPQANRERVIVRSNLPSSVPPVVADRRTMRQIALNLVANAIRFTPAGGQIIASTTYTVEGDVLLRFRDSGIGMTEREIEIALTPFQQVHAPSVTRGEGTGLGLPLTKAMVEANRAAFAINSVPGEGTLVEITFPSQRVLAD